MVKGIETTYLDFTRKTAKYPKRREKEYLMIGLMNEAGEVGGAYKKEIRDRKIPSRIDREKILP